MKIEISTLKKYIKEGNVIESIDYELFSEYLNSENLEILDLSSFKRKTTLLGIFPGGRFFLTFLGPNYL